jgi:hypothetical protein
LIIIFYFGIVFYLFYSDEKIGSAIKCSLTDCNILRYNFTNAVNNLNNEYSISVDKLRDILKNG